MSWGRAVHLVLEAIGSERVDNLDLFLRNVLEIEERDPADKAKLKELILSVINSSFWRRALQAEKRCFETPFCIKTNGKALGRADSRPVILSGVIDIVFWEKDGWVIADYKTDAIIDKLQSYVDYYAPQVRLYSRFWETLSGEKVKEAGLYFTAVDRWIKI
jgi:ATP-dependent helicase/nuclease subunit A